jgi:methylthioribose-1-phosphate isomerase
MSITTIEFLEPGIVRVLDQRHLPGAEVRRDLTTVEEVADAIETLAVRGAPLIGIAAAMGVALAARAVDPAPSVDRAIHRLRGTRPTAVNLTWALERLSAVAAVTKPEDLGDALLAEARALHDQDAAMCRRIGEAGLPFFPDGTTAITYCNAGALATGGIGTALAPIYLAHEAGRAVRVIVPETRPLLQGARLTAWELSRAGIPCTVTTDGMVASRLACGDVTVAITGADRIAGNGDVANKVGTLGLALLARHYGLPFYVAAPRSTFDPGTASGDDIPIEHRDEDEVRFHGSSAVAARVPAWNPAFDVTPAALVTGFITDDGLVDAAGLRERWGV